MVMERFVFFMERFTVRHGADARLTASFRKFTASFSNPTASFCELTAAFPSLTASVSLQLQQSPLLKVRWLSAIAPLRSQHKPIDNGQRTAAINWQLMDSYLPIVTATLLPDFFTVAEP